MTTYTAVPLQCSSKRFPMRFLGQDIGPCLVHVVGKTVLVYDILIIVCCDDMQYFF